MNDVLWLIVVCFAVALVLSPLLIMNAAQKIERRQREEAQAWAAWRGQVSATLSRLATTAADIAERIPDYGAIDYETAAETARKIGGLK